MKKNTDLIGNKFGRLTVIKQECKNDQGRIMYLCECECGNSKVVKGDNLKYNRTKSCGCLVKERNSRRGTYIDITGQSFYRWKVLYFSHIDENSQTYWNCVCECGNKGIVLGNNLRRGKTKSCGCLRKEMVNKSVTTHGYSKGNRNPEYKVWCAMKRRCETPSDTNYHNYGARGIKVCERWSNFENFIEDMGDKPSPKHTIERKDVNGDYEPSNCMWITMTEQMRNRRILKNNKTGVNGVFYDKNREKYSVTIGVDGKSIFLGRFNTLEEAIKAREEAELKHWGKSSK